MPDHQDNLSGVLETLEELLAITGTAEDAAGTNTIIGLLKQIAENTTPE